MTTSDPGYQPKFWLWVEAIRQALTSHYILILLFTAMCLGVLHGRALASIFTGTIASIALIDLVLRRRIETFPVFFAFTGVFVLYVVSGMHSDDLREWWRHVWNSLPYLLIPFGLYAWRHVNGIVWQRLLYIYIGVCVFSACTVLADYALNFEEYNALYNVGKTIPTPVIHVRYSYFIALASVLAFALWLKGTLPATRTRVITAAMGVFLAVFVHILAVRTGLLAFYGGILTLILITIIHDRRWKLALAVAGMIGVMMLIAYQNFPSLTNKIAYVRYDLQMLFDRGATAEYSDNVRITSIRHGISLIKEHPVTGTGIGDLRQSMEAKYTRYNPDFPPEQRYPPISQYIYVFTAFGIAGGLLYFVFLLYPVFRGRLNYPLAAICSSTLFSCIAETTITLQLGQTAFLALACTAIMAVRQNHTGIAG